MMRSTQKSAGREETFLSMDVTESRIMYSKLNYKTTVTPSIKVVYYIIKIIP